MGTLENFYRHQDFVRCRTFGHAWEDIPVTETHVDGYSFWLRCVHCTGERHDVIDRRYGEVLHRSYHMPMGYALAIDEVPTRADFRLRLMSVAENLADARRARQAHKSTKAKASDGQAARQAS